MASHLDGINSLPRWDPNNPTKYAYDWRNYDASDYAAFKQARLDAEAKRAAAAKARSKEVLKEANKAIRDKIKETKHGGKNASLAEVKSAAKAGKRLYANVDSTCFDELSWVADKDGDGTTGTITGWFHHSPGPYSGPCDLDEFIDACSGSLGEAYADYKWF